MIQLMRAFPVNLLFRDMQEILQLRITLMRMPVQPVDIISEKINTLFISLLVMIYTFVNLPFNREDFLNI